MAATIETWGALPEMEENPENGRPVGIFYISGAAAGETFDFSIVDTVGDRFTIQEQSQDGVTYYWLLVKDGSFFDFENPSARNITVTLTATSNAEANPTSVSPRDVAITLTDVAEAPTGLTVAGGIVSENSDVGTVVATLAAQDQDAGDTFTYSFVTDASGRTPASSNLFEISNNEIKLKAELDNPQVGAHTLWVKVKDSTGLSYVKQITITVTNVEETLNGSTKNDRLTGTADIDIINGGNGNDWLDGLVGDDTLNGDVGNDTLYGKEGNDVLNGGLGKDKLYGGAGQDVFVFDTPVKKGHFDQIYDFKSSDDTLQFSLAGLKAFKLKVGKKSVAFDKIFKQGKALEKKFFDVGTKATDKPDGSNDYIFYNKKNGIVYLDVDGSGKAKGIEILKVKPGTALGAGDFLFV